MAAPQPVAPPGGGVGPVVARSRGPSRAACTARPGRLIALPLLLAAFTVGRPEPLPKPALPPSFDGRPRLSSHATSPASLPTACPARRAPARQRTGCESRLEDVQPHRPAPVASSPTYQASAGRARRTSSPARSGPAGSARADAIVVLRERDNLGLSPGLDRQRLGYGRADRARPRTSRRSPSPTRSSSSRPTVAPLAISERRSSPGDRLARRQTSLAVVTLDALAGTGRASGRVRGRRRTHARRRAPLDGRCQRPRPGGAPARATRTPSTSCSTSRFRSACTTRRRFSGAASRP